MWELQGHMHQYIAPSIDKASNGEDNPREWLEFRFADQTSNEDCSDYDDRVAIAKDLATDTLINSIVDNAIEYAGTTNGAWEVYLDEWTSVPWCSDEECLEWYA